MKSVRIRSFSGPYFSSFGPGKLRIRKIFTQWNQLKNYFCREKDACIHYCYYCYYCEFNLNLFEFLWNYHYYYYKSLTVWKMFIFGVFLVCIFPYSDWIRRDTEYLSVFCPNAAKCVKNGDQNNSEYGHFLRSKFG